LNSHGEIVTQRQAGKKRVKYQVIKCNIAPALSRAWYVYRANV
jgi:hypothetical protein